MQEVSDVVHWLPTLLPHPFTTADVLRVGQTPCELHQLLVPLAGRVRRWMNPYHQRDALPGLFLPVWWDLRLRPIQPLPYGDEQSLLQSRGYVLKGQSWRVTDPADPPVISLEELPEAEIVIPPRDQPRLHDDMAYFAFQQRMETLVSNGLDVSQRLQVTTVGLHIQHVGQREVLLRDVEASTILNAIRQVWRDIRHPFKAILAHPPVEDSTRIIFIVEFFDAHRPPIPGTTPVLRRVFDPQEGDTNLRAAYHVGAVNPYLLLGQVPLRHRCEPWGPLRCAVRRNGESLLPLAQPVLEEGDFLDFFVYPPDPLDLDEDDGLALMQTRAASRTPRRAVETPSSQSSASQPILAHVFHMSSEHRLLSLDRTRPLTFIEQISAVWALPPHNRLTDLHQVHHPPLDLESSADVTFILEMTADRGRQALPNDQLILFDLVIVDAGNTDTAAHIRKVLWASHSMTRVSFLHLVSSHALCDLPEMECTLWNNQAMWPKEDEASRQFLHGDYLRLQVNGPPTMPATEIQVMLCEQEMAEVHRYIFRSSPTPSPIPSTPEGENSESERQEDDESVENLTQVFEIFEDSDVFSVEDTTYPESNGKMPLADISNLRADVCRTDVDLTTAEKIPSASKGLPQTLCLEDLLPEKPTALVCLPGIDDLATRLIATRSQLEVAIPLVDQMSLEVLSQLSFCGYDEIQKDPPEKLLVYTDGSKLWNHGLLDVQSAWAFVVCAKWPASDQQWVVGFQHGAVCLQEDHEAWVGASVSDSYQAEVVALIFATLWLCQEPLFYTGTPCELVADSTSALFGADGTFQIHHPVLSKVLRPLQRFASAFAPVRHRWQKAHSGEPHNELADHLAKVAAREPQPSFGSVPFRLCAELTALQWVWLSAEQVNESCRSTWPEVTSEGIKFPVPGALQSHDITPVQTTGQGHLHLELQVTSFNVNSFKDAKISNSGRTELLRTQTLAHKSLVSAWQETRRRHSSQWKNGHHIGFEAAAYKGAGGVALWFRHDIPFAYSQMDQTWHPCFFHLEDFVVEIEEPELLVVKYKSSIWTALFVSAHAPNDLAKEEIKDAFWKGLQAKLARWVAIPVFLCIDANARLGSTTSSAVGHFSPEEENDNGHRFHALLLENRLFLPSTVPRMVSHPHEEQGTWLAKNGWKRIDYVAIPQQFATAKIQTWVHTFEKDVAKEDHRAVSIKLQATMVLYSKATQHVHPMLPANRNAMQTMQGKAACSKILQYMCDQQPPWHASADVHANYLNAAASQCLPSEFPLTKRKPKPTWIQDQTWEKFKDARTWRRQLRALRSQERLGMLRLVFRQWATSTPCLEKFTAWIKEVDFATASALHKLKSSQRDMIRLLREDESTYIAHCAQIKHDELTEAKGTLLWRKLRSALPSFRKKSKKHLPFALAHEQLHAHFAGIEEAKIKSMDEMCEESQRKSVLALQATHTKEFSGAQLPSVFELETAIRATASGKACIGCLPLELLKADPPKAAELLLPMMVHFFRFQQQPLSWKGGAYFPLYKGKGGEDDPSSFRAILIGNVIPKLYHRIVRQRLIKEVAPHLLPFQIGGVPRMTVSYAAHFLVALRQHAEVSKRSTAIIFFDLKSAFYRAQRSTVVRDQLGYGEDHLDEDVAIDTLVQPSALSELQVHPNLQATIQELFSATWNTVKVACGHENPPMQSTRGTRPGDPVADLAFTCVMQTILSRFLQDARDLLPVIPSAEGDQVVPPITWVDDVAIFLESEQAAQIIPQVQQVVALMYKHCRAYGLDLNFAPGKTEALLRLHGRCSTQIRKKVFQEKFLPVTQEPGEKILLSVTSQYTHLGLKHTATMGFEAEFSFRFARARQALAECRKKIIKNKSISPETRWNLARSLILSRLFFGCELWPILSQKQQTSLQAFLTKIGRVILGMENFADAPHTTDDEVVAKLMIPSVISLLRTARLRYLARMVNYAPKILHLILERLEFADNDAWMTRVRCDVQWLQRRVSRLRHLPDPLVEWDAWLSQLRDVRDWSAAAGSALQADTTHRHLQARYRVWRKSFQQHLHQLGMRFQAEEAVPRPSHIVCEHCNKGFLDRKALSVHLYKVHGRHASVRQFMDSTVCGACLKDFHNIQKLRQHLQYKKGRCLGILQSVWFPFEEDGLQGFAPTAEIKSAHRLLAMQCFGPLLPSRDDWQRERPSKPFPDIVDSQEMRALMDESQDQLPQDDHPSPAHHSEERCDGLFEQLVQYVTHAELPFNPPTWDLMDASAFATLTEFAACLQDELVYEMDPQLHLEVFWWLEKILAEHFRLQRDPAFPQPAEVPPKHIPKTAKDTKTAPEWLQDHRKQIVDLATPIPRAPAQATGTKYILYAYAGHRREGDVVEWTEFFNKKFSANIIMVTVDIVYEAELCDLRTEKSKAFWLDAVKAGYFSALLGAPPCETWSAARFRALLLNDGGPPPLRSLEEPWGLADGVLKHQKQVLVANDLLQVWITMMVAALFSDTPYLMEHPAPSRYISEAPSVWKLAELSWLEMLPSAKRHLIYQGLFGAPSAKPTVFFVHKLPQFEQILRSWQDPEAHPANWIQLSGKDQNGAWKTTRAKAYPARLNAALVENVFRQALADFDVQPDNTFTSAVATIVAAQRTSGQTLGPDYVQ